ncbi:MAG: PTS mannose/fructose/sorbose transporter subunit IIB [Gemmatimonadales bacterium]|nr:MAG: PTS mannose/fructose/sorbose transporter subunit IIB [Gemmatimonadales bacterium]
MPIALYRVDERLIHGQVTVGWGSVLQPDHYLVVDDELAASEWETELYRLGLPPGVRASFLTTEAALDELERLRSAPEVTVLLTRSLPAMAALSARGDMDGVKVNLGGLHDAPGRRRVLTYLHLDDSDVEAIRRLDDAGARVTARDLPSTPPAGLERLLGPDE